jgi:hypothetical protein
VRKVKLTFINAILPLQIANGGRAYFEKKIVEYFYCSNHYTALFFILKYVLMDATSGAGTAYPSRAPEFTLGILITGSRCTFINICEIVRKVKLTFINAILPLQIANGTVY